MLKKRTNLITSLGNFTVEASVNDVELAIKKKKLSLPTGFNSLEFGGNNYTYNGNLTLDLNNPDVKILGYQAFEDLTLMNNEEELKACERLRDDYQARIDILKESIK